MRFGFRFLKDWRFRKILVLALSYTLLSLAYSLMGFAHPVPPELQGEYTAPRLLTEVGGHFVFGFVASLPLLDLGMSTLTGALAVLIDSDHIFSSLGLSVTGRPDHSILYALVSLVVLVYIAKRLGFTKSTLVKIAFIAPVTLLSHISYDLFAGTGPGFPLLVPFSFAEITLPFYFWYVLEGSALIISAAAYFVSRRIQRTNRRSEVLQKNPYLRTREP